MHLNNYVKVSLIGLVCLLSSVSFVTSANAQFPSFDPAAILKKVQGGINQVQQKVKMVTQCKAVTEINNAIGKAKSMAAMAQSKAEELKKQAEKIKKLKEDAEKKLEKAKELKEKYEAEKAKLQAYQDKIKAQAEQAKQKIADAKNAVDNVKNQATAKLNEAKSAVDNVKNQATAKINEAKSAVDSAKSAVDNAKNQATAKINEAKSAVDNAKNTVDSVKNQATDKLNEAKGAINDVKDQADAARAMLDEKVGQLKGEDDAEEELEDEELEGETSLLSAKNKESNKLDENLEKKPETTPLASEKTTLENKLQGETLTSKEVQTTPIKETTLTPLTSKTTAVQTTPDMGTTSAPTALKSQPVAKSAGRVSFSQPTENTITTEAPVKEVVSETQPKVLDESKVVIKDENVVPEKTTLEKKLQGETLTTKEVKEVPVKEITIATEAPVKEVVSETQPKALDESKVVIKDESVVPENEGVAKIEQETPLVPENESVAKIEKAANEEGSLAALRTFKQTMTEAVRNGDTKTLGAISEMDTSKIINSNSKIYEPKSTGATKNTVGRKAFTVSPSKNNTTSKKPGQKLQKNSLWQDDGEFARQSRVKLSYADTLQFATEACDYDYKMVVEANGKTNEIIILPETLARECCIKPEDLKDMNVIADCIAKFGKKMNGNDESERATVQGIVSDIVFEQAEHGNVEALEDKAVSNSYKKDILGPLIDSVTNVQDNNSGISNISVANVQMLYLLNRLRKIYTGSLIMSGLSSINSISKEAVDEEAELGLGGASDQEYAYQVTRSDGTVAINSPIIPENLARKCHFNLDSDSSVMKDCYIKVFNEQFETDKDETARAFIDSIEYQGTQDVLKKGLYQKVKSAEYEEGKMKETNEAVQDGSDAHKNKEAMLTTESEMLFALNDIINLQASRIGYNGLKTLHKLMPTEQASTGK